MWSLSYTIVFVVLLYDSYFVQGVDFYLPKLISNSGETKPQRGNTSAKNVLKDKTDYKPETKVLTRKSAVSKDMIISVRKNEAIFQQAESECHSSSLTETASGALLAVWFAGTEENSPDVGIYGSHFTGGAWGPPIELVPPIQRGASPCGRAKGVRCKGMMSTWNPVVTTLPSGEVLLFYKTGVSPSEWTGYVMRSSDSGHTWSAAEEMPQGVAGPAKNKPLVLPTGRILSPASTEAVGPPNPTGGRERIWKCWVDESLDGGRTWSRRGPIPFYGNIIQPVFYIGDDSNVRMLARSATEMYPDGRKADTYRDPKNRKHIVHPGKKYAMAAVADSNGENWSEAFPVPLANPNSGLDAVKLRNGAVIAAHNDMWDTDEALGAQCPKFRCRLSLSLSLDDGLTWEPILKLADAKGDVENSYPAIIQTRNGDIHVTYTDRRKTIRHVILDVLDSQ